MALKGVFLSVARDRFGSILDLVGGRPKVLFAAMIAVLLVVTVPACFSDLDEVDPEVGTSSGRATTTDADGSTSGPGISGATSNPDSSTTSTAASSGSESGSESGTGSGGSSGGCALDFELNGECTDTPEGMAAIGPLSFTMGCDVPVEEGSCEFDEFPTHEVELRRFAIDLHEVTVSEYEGCVARRACSPRSGEGCAGPIDDHPANCVLWSQAVAYCEWVSKRLPTEAEWEAAAEHDDNRRWPWGEDPNPNCDYAVVVDGGPGCGTDAPFPVGSKEQGETPDGVSDLVGNVQEWVADWYAEDAYGSHAPSDPTGPRSGTERVVRGSSFLHGTVASNRVRNRWPLHPGVAVESVGFRCAVSAQEPRLD